jgi:hypothetical protein
MSKAMLALLLLVSVVICDPPWALQWLGPQAQTFGWKLKSALDINQILPRLSPMGKG